MPAGVAGIVGVLLPLPPQLLRGTEQIMKSAQTEIRRARRVPLMEVPGRFARLARIAWGFARCRRKIPGAKTAHRIATKIPNTAKAGAAGSFAKFDAEAAGPLERPPGA